MPDPRLTDRPPAPSPARGGRRRSARAALVLVLLLAGACAEGEGEGTADPAPSASSAPADDAGRPLGSVEALAAELDAAGYPCALEYEGLEDGDKELSLCTVGGEQVTLSIWNDPAQLEAFRASPAEGAPGVTVIGADWTIDLADPTLAAALRDDLAEDLAAEVRAG